MLNNMHQNIFFMGWQIPKTFFSKLFLVHLMVLAGTCGAFAQTENFIRIDSVSVIPENGHVMIGWTLQTEETEGFIEVNRQLTGGTYGLITIIDNVLVSNFIDNGINANLASQSYFVTAFDAGGGTLAPSLAHRTIFLNEPEADFCLGEVTLYWTNYQVTTTTSIPSPRPVPFNNIRVQISSDGITFQNLAPLPHPDETIVGIQDFTIPGLAPGQYFFRIQAFNSETGHTSTSNVRSFGLNPPTLLDLQIDYVDIFENQEARISLSAMGDTGDFFFELYRSDDPSGAFELAGSSPAPAVVVDYPEINKGPWYYRSEAFFKDYECELPAIETQDDFSSIFLQATSRGNPREIMINREHHFPSDRYFYYQLKMQTGADNWQDVPGFVDNGSGEFVHQFSPGELVGTVIYKMEAREEENPSRVISSNYAVIELEPVVNIPNAFRPTSNEPVNTVFKPDFLGYSPVNYQLRIFNRWGQQIFFSNDAEQGWDGNLNGTAASPGVYSYLLQYSAPDGKTFEKRGVVTLVY
jgi:gliding motility-associated-like protein